MITRFECHNFRNIDCSDLNFARINIMIGANNSGKSNFIRALSFAANMVSNPHLDSTGFLSELKRNGWDSVVNKRTDETDFYLSWDFELAKGYPVSYVLRANTGRQREDNYILEETLDRAEVRLGNDRPYNFFRCHNPNRGSGVFSKAGMKAQKNARLKADVDSTETVLLQMDNLFFKNKEMFSTPFIRDEIRDVLHQMRQYFQSFLSYSCTAFNLTAIREPQSIQNDGAFLKKDGSNFANVLSWAAKHSDNFVEHYRRALRRLVNGCDDYYISEENGQLVVNLMMDGVSFPLSEVSDGTVHLLLLLLLLNLPEDSGISMLAIDEPEMNLHPAWQQMLAQEILRCNSFRQCFISTHSPDFLDEFTEDFLTGEAAVFVFDGASKIPIRRLDPQALENDLREWNLGDLYRVNDPLIGGWPS